MLYFPFTKICERCSILLQSKVDPDGMSGTTDHRMTKKSKVWLETSKAQGEKRAWR